MSYSRLGSSRWYTFWETSSSNVKEEQVFAICDIARPHHFTWRQLNENIEECLDKVRAENNKEVTGKLLANGNFLDPVYEEVTYEALDVTEQEYNELKSYMQHFLKDVEERLS